MSISRGTGHVPEYWTWHDGVVEPGMLVTIRFVGDSEPETPFLLGAREMAGDDVEVFSPQSPLGSALTDHTPGETVEYSLPNGRTASVEIVAVEPYTD